MLGVMLAVDHSVDNDTVPLVGDALITKPLHYA